MKNRKVNQSWGAIAILALIVTALYSFLPSPRAAFCENCAEASIAAGGLTWWDANTATCSHYTNPGALYICGDTIAGAAASLAPCTNTPVSYNFTATASGGLNATPLGTGVGGQTWLITVEDPQKPGQVQITAQATHDYAKTDDDWDCGPITVSASATIIYDPHGGCFSCGSSSAASLGSGDNRVNSVGGADFKLFLGQTPYGTKAGYLELLASKPSAALAQPAALQVPFLENGVALVTNGSGAIAQVLTKQGLVNVAVQDTYNYSLQCFYASAVGPTNLSGLYTTNAPAFSTWTVSNPDGAAANNRLWITNNLNGVVSAYEYTYTASSVRWDLVKPDGQTNSAWSLADPGNSNVTNYFEQVTMGTQVLMQKQKTYLYIPSASCVVLTQLVEGVTGQTRTNTYTYYTNGGGANLLKQANYWDGNWLYLLYDSYGRKVTNYSAYNNSAPPTSGPPDPTTALCKETDYTYSAAPTTTTDWAAYIPYGTTVMLPASQGGGTWAMKQVSSSYDSVSANSSQRTDSITRYDASGSSLSSQNVVSLVPGVTLGRPLSVQNEDGTTISYSYPDQFTTIETDPDGSQKTTVIDGWGNPIAFTNIDTTTTPHVILARTLYAYTNSGVPYEELRRSHDETDLAGRKTQYRWYDCCGVSTVTNADGAGTVYTYDILKRQAAATQFYGGNSGIQTTNALDALGRVLISQRIGTDSSTIALQKNQYDIFGNLFKQTNALGGVTTITNVVIAGQPYATNTYPDGGTRIETYYRDGRLQSVTGTAVQDAQYTYDVEQDPNTGYWREATTETRLDSSGNPTSEWTKTFSDGFGRPYLTLYSAASAYPSSKSFYNDYGRLWKTIDPDGVVTFYTYYDSSADINQGSRQYTIVALDPSTQAIGDYASLVSSLGALQGGIDRLTLQHQSVIPAGSGLPDLVRSTSYVWTNGESDATGTLISSSDNSTSGLTNSTTAYRDPATAVLSQTKTAYYSSGTGHSLTNIAPDGSYTVSVYSYGRLTSVTHFDAINNQLSSINYGYDSHGRQSTATDARNGTTTYAFNSADLITSVTTPAPGNGQSPQTTTTDYDTSLRAWRATQPDNTSVTNEFFPSGLLRATYGARTYPVGYSYDYSGRMKTMTNWSNFSSGAGARVTTWNYDTYRGWLTGKTYDGGVAGPSYTYTHAGRLNTRVWTRTIGGQPLTTTYGYDNAGDLVSITYSDTTPCVTNVIDRLGRQAGVTNGTTVTLLTLNLAGETLLETNVTGALAGLSVTNAFDQFLRRTNLVLQLSTTPLLQHSFSFDSAGRLSTVSDGTNNATYSYLANSPLVSQITFKSNSVTRMTTTKLWDFLNRLTSISSSSSASASFSFNYSYNPANQRVQVNLADGSFWAYKYDKLGQVISGKKYWQDWTPVAGQQFEYAFDDTGNRTQTKAGGDENGSSLRTAIYSANTLNQYTSRDVPAYADIFGASFATSSVTVNALAAYRHGEYFRKELTVDNSTAAQWTNITAAATGQTSVTGHVFLAQTPEVLAYDADGNLTNDGRWTYTWDAENRLVNMTSYSGAPTGSKLKLDLLYDSKGRRIEKIVSTNNGSVYVPQSTNVFAYDGWNLIGVLSPASRLVSSFAWGLDLSRSSQGAGGVGELLAIGSYGAQATNWFVAFDGNGNVAALLSASDGTVSARYEYGPFGEMLRSTGPAARANQFRFSTKFLDDETDLIYYGYRYYSLGTGRAASRDPGIEAGADAEFGFWNRGIADEDGDSNPYRLLLNNPVGLIDRLGLATEKTAPDKKPACACKCKDVKISYTPKLKDGKLRFEVYKNPNTKGKQFGFTLHIYWTADGDPARCTYGVNEPAGGVTGTDPEGEVQPSKGTGGLWRSVPQKWDDHPGIPLDLKGDYTINVDLTQTYGCWDAGVDASTQPPSKTVGPMHYTGSGATKY